MVKVNMIFHRTGGEKNHSTCDNSSEVDQVFLSSFSVNCQVSVDAHDQMHVHQIECFIDA